MLTAGQVSSALLADWGPIDSPLCVLIDGVMYPVKKVMQINGKFVLVTNREGEKKYDA